MWPHRQQPTRLPHPWDSPGKDTGVGCHFLLQCRKVKSESEVAQSCPTLSDPMDCSLPGSSVHGIFQARVLEWGAIVSPPQPQGWPSVWRSGVPWHRTHLSRVCSSEPSSNKEEGLPWWLRWLRIYLLIQEMQARFLGQEDPLEKEMATHSSILIWRIPWTEEPGRLQSTGHKESDTTEAT